MHRRRDHAIRLPAEGTGHGANTPGLVGLAGGNPFTHGVLSVEPAPVHGPGLRVGDSVRVPAVVQGGRQPVLRIVLEHCLGVFEAFDAILAAAVLPSLLAGHPVAAHKLADGKSVGTVPGAVDMVVREARLGGVVVAVHRFDDAVGVVDVDDRRSGLEEQFQLSAGEVAVRHMAALRRGGFVNVADHDVRGVIANQLLHLTGLANSFLELGPAQLPEQRQIGLHHHAQAVTHIVELGLLGALRQAEEVHVGELGNEDVLDQLLLVAFHHRDFKIAHGVGAAQDDRLAVEVQGALHGRCVVHAELAHAEMVIGNIERPAVLGTECGADGVEIRAFGLPGAEVAEAHVDTVLAGAGARRRGLNRNALESGTMKVLGVDGEREIDVAIRVVPLVDFDAHLDSFPLQVGPNKEAGDGELGTALEINFLPDAGSGRATMPTENGIVPARPYVRIDLVAIHCASGPGTGAGHDCLVLDANDEDVFGVAAEVWSNIGLEGRKIALVCDHHSAVDINLTLVVDCGKVQHDGLLLPHAGWDVEHLAVKARPPAEGATVIRDAHALPDAFAAPDAGKVAPVLGLFHPELECVQLDASARDGRGRRVVSEERPVLLPQLAQGGLKFLAGAHDVPLRKIHRSIAVRGLQLDSGQDRGRVLHQGGARRRRRLESDRGEPIDLQARAWCGILLPNCGGSAGQQQGCDEPDGYSSHEFTIPTIHGSLSCSARDRSSRCCTCAEGLL